MNKPECTAKLLQRRQLLIVGAATCASACLGVSCGSPMQSDDAGTKSDAGVSDAGSNDAGTVRDAGSTVDAGSTADAGPRDAGTPVDAGTTADAGTQSDAGQQDSGVTSDAGASCAGTVVGQASSFVLGTAVSFTNYFVVRDSSGLYALSALCTHAGCAVEQTGNTFSCGCHGSQFDLNGGVNVGPAVGSLAHYAVCVDANGNVSANTNVIVSDNDRA